eukprot:gene17841-21245_t
MALRVVSTETVKILVSGDVKGQFKKLFSSVDKVNKKAGPFAALFCVGQFFGATGETDELLPYLEGSKTIPVPTYFIYGNEISSSGIAELLGHRMEAGGELCPNLTFLGRQGIKEISGLSVCFLSGRYDDESYREPKKSLEGDSIDTCYHESEVDELIAKASESFVVGHDILLTSEWGQGFHRLLPLEASIPMHGPLERAGSPAVARLASEADFRYHFVGTLNVHYQLAPFQNKVHSTRLYGMGALGNAGKVKAMQGFSVPPVKTAPRSAFAEEKEKATLNPYTRAPTAHGEADEEEVPEAPHTEEDYNVQNISAPGESMQCSVQSILGNAAAKFDVEDAGAGGPQAPNARVFGAMSQ